MQHPPVPKEENERLTSLQRYAVLDTLPEATFDRLANLAARLFEMPLALISLLDKDRQWFKACQGPACEGFARETSRDIAFCAYTILSNTVLVVEDASLDPRFADNPWVTGELGLRFYAGAPLIGAEGQALGALCLLDFQPRTFTAAQQSALQDLAASVVSELDLRRSTAALSERELLYRQMFADNPHPMWVYDTETLRFLEVNDAALLSYGYSRAEFLALTLFAIRFPEDIPLLEAHLSHSLPASYQSGAGRGWRHRTREGKPLWVEIASHSIQHQGRKARLVIAQDITARYEAEEALQRSLSMLQAQQEAALDGILVVDENRRIVSYNQRLCELWNTPPEIIQSGSDERHLGYALSLLKNPDEFLQRVMYLYEHPSEHSRDEVEMRDGRTFDRYSGPVISAEGKFHGRVWYFRDVTERRQIEESLRQSEQRLSLHLQQTPLAVIELTLDLTITYWNKAAEAIFGFTAAEMLGQDGLLQLVPDEDRDYVKKTCAVLNAQSSSGRGRNHNRTKSGRIIICDWHMTPLVDEQGHMIGIAALAHDITEEQRALDELASSEARKATILETALDGIISVDHTGAILEWNPAAERTFGYSRQEALGRAVDDLIVPPTLRAPMRQQLEQYLATGDGLPLDQRAETILLHRSGLEFPVEFSATAVQVNNYPIFTIYLRDITEQKHDQEALRRSESRKSAILETALDSIISIDEQGSILEWNPAAETTFGYLREEALGQALADLIVPPELRAAHRQGMARYLKTGEGTVLGLRLELPAQRRDGTEFPVELAVTATEVNGSPVFMAYVRDITEQKRLESEREALLAQTETLLAEALARADRDPLTNLLNHRAFHKRLTEELNDAERTGQSLAVLLMDLNNFKFFNDAYGHLAGDDVLKQVAQALQWAGRAQDVLGRFGGDEFALLMPGADQAAVLHQAQEMHAAIALVSYQPPGYETAIPFSLSLGIACFPEDGPTRTDLLEAAASSLRVAKTGGEDEHSAFSLRRDLAHSLGGFTMLDALVTAVDNKDRYTRRHSEDVLDYSVQIARALGMDAKTQQIVKIAALLHDVGKIGVPDAVLRKPGKLAEDEYEAIKQHPLMGAIIVGAVAGFEDMLDAVRHHHERWDGMGYPFGLHGEEIPLMARLMAVADAYSAMTTDRPYRKGMESTRALGILEAGAGTQWDPECVRAFLRVRRTDRLAAACDAAD